MRGAKQQVQIQKTREEKIMLESLSVAALLFQPLLHRPRIACCDSLNTSLLSSFHLFPPPDSPRPYLSEYLITALSCFFCFVLFFSSLQHLSLFSLPLCLFSFIIRCLSSSLPRHFFLNPSFISRQTSGAPRRLCTFFIRHFFSLCNLFKFPISEK